MLHQLQSIAKFQLNKEELHRPKVKITVSHVILPLIGASFFQASQALDVGRGYVWILPVCHDGREGELDPEGWQEERGVICGNIQPKLFMALRSTQKSTGVYSIGFTHRKVFSESRDLLHNEYLENTKGLSAQGPMLPIGFTKRKRYFK
ncbi:uncharacterized protein LOC143839726 [Paroedura picta]|uniref:uncharacterized protein LOC143839726 n=1 Tax=Paroedura picta TaxID=143630 RepID=UPI0040568FDF